MPASNLYLSDLGIIGLVYHEIVKKEWHPSNFALFQQFSGRKYVTMHKKYA